MSQFIYLPLQANVTEANRIFWNKTYFDLEMLLLFPNQLSNKENVEKYVKNALLIVKMTPFQNQFKAKLFSSLLDEHTPQETNVIAMTLSLDIIEQKINKIEDIQEMTTTVDGRGQSHFDGKKSHPLRLTDAEQQTLFTEIELLMKGALAPHLEQPFASFIEKYASNYLKKDGISKHKMVCYSDLLPFLDRIDCIEKNALYILKDFYCTNHLCDCREAKCIVIMQDPTTGQDVTIGGFRYLFDTQKFKPMQEFQTEINAKEWFKRFGSSAIISLPVLLESRYKTLRTH